MYYHLVTVQEKYSLSAPYEKGGSSLKLLFNLNLIKFILLNSFGIKRAILTYPAL